MRIEPDVTEALQDQAFVAAVLRTVLRRIAPPDAGEPDGSLSALDLRYPGAYALAFEVQAACRAGAPGRRLAARVTEVAAQARSSAERARASGCPSWQVDLAPPEPHLRDSVARALAQVPGRPGTPAEADLVGWADPDRTVFCAAACLLASAWPDALAEMAAVVRQVALLGGRRLAGFTDFHAHGAVFVNRLRLEPGDGGLPAPVRLAEALVHEAAHNRCNAAAMSRPFLAESGQDPRLLLATPLRRDPRPLTGLFQQVVVLVRCRTLYDRLLDAPDALGDAPTREAVRARRERLSAQARQAVATIRDHRGALTDHGRAVVAEAETALRDRGAVAR